MKYRKFYETLNVPVDPETRRRIEEIASEREITMAALVREILTNALHGE